MKEMGKQDWEWILKYTHLGLDAAYEAQAYWMLMEEQSNILRVNESVSGPYQHLLDGYSARKSDTLRLLAVKYVTVKLHGIWSGIREHRGNHMQMFRDLIRGIDGNLYDSMEDEDVRKWRNEVLVHISEKNFKSMHLELKSDGHHSLSGTRYRNTVAQGSRFIKVPIKSVQKVRYALQAMYPTLAKLYIMASYRFKGEPFDLTKLYLTTPTFEPDFRLPDVVRIDGFDSHIGWSMQEETD